MALDGGRPAADDGEHYGARPPQSIAAAPRPAGVVGQCGYD